MTHQTHAHHKVCFNLRFRPFVRRVAPNAVRWLARGLKRLPPPTKEGGRLLQPELHHCGCDGTFSSVKKPVTVLRRPSAESVAKSTPFTNTGPPSGPSSQANCARSWCALTSLV